MRGVVIAPLLEKHLGEGVEILDLGGYDGSLTADLQRSGARVTLVDLDPQGVAVARRNGLDAICASAEQIPFPAAHFDIVICCDLLVAVSPEQEAPIFREIVRVLKPTGFFIVTSPTDDLVIPLVPMSDIYASWQCHEGVSRARLLELAGGVNAEVIAERAYFGWPARLYYALAFFKNVPRRGTRLKRAVFKRLIQAESVWCLAPQAHLIVARPRA